MLEALGIFFLLLIAIVLVKQLALRIIFHVSHRLIGKPHIGIWFYSLAFFPGTVIHELSHYFMAKILFVKTGEINLWPKQEGGYLTLGYVVIRKTDPLRSFLVGLAPFFVGLAATAIVSNYWFSTILRKPSAPFESISTIQNLMRTPITWVILYGLLVVSHAMFPSRADRKEIFLIPATVITLGAFLLYIHAAVPQVITTTATNNLSQINQALLIVLSINIGFLLVLWLLRKLFDTIF